MQSVGSSCACVAIVCVVAHNLVIKEFGVYKLDRFVFLEFGFLYVYDG